MAPSFIMIKPPVKANLIARPAHKVTYHQILLGVTLDTIKSIYTARKYNVKPVFGK